MRHIFRKMGALIFFCCLISVVTYRNASALSEQEMKVLQMFYKEKDLVVSSTRSPKAISQIAENITVITAEEIEAMNAHSVSDILSRLPGLYISWNRDFGAASLIAIQGSEERHVLVLLDEIPWNLLSEGSAQTNSIPVGIIEKIEIIKGPASSSWGSALGGVVNIITKSTGTDPVPSGSVQASWGKNSSQDYRAEISGLGGPLQYYLFAGNQTSNGLVESRYFDNTSFYSKFEYPAGPETHLTLSMGYSDPEIGLGDFPSGDIHQTFQNRNFFATASVDAAFTEELRLKASLYQYNQDTLQDNTSLGLGFYGPLGARALQTDIEEKTTGARGQLTWVHKSHQLVLGVDYDRGRLDQRLNAGPVLQTFGVPPASINDSSIEQWAVYINDTITTGYWSITPGIRYDYNDISGSFVSPSLGVTYLLGEETILRASMARGFTLPPPGLDLHWRAVRKSEPGFKT